jgi:hypothetical protein
MNDQIEPSTIEVTGGSPDVLSWPATATITRVTLLPNDVRFEYVKPGEPWPHVTPPGWSGGIQLTLWIVVNRDGRWRTTGSIEFYQGDRPKVGSGSPLSSGQADWWYYAPEIGQPQPGELVGLFIAAGDQRRKDVRSVEERSNIVTFTVPPNDTGVFTFATADTLPPFLNHPPGPANDTGTFTVPPGNADVSTQLDRIEAAIAAERAENDAFRQEARNLVRQLGAQFSAPRGGR